MSFIVKTCTKREREPVINGSKMYAYLLEFETGQKCELLQKPETPAPTSGQSLEGEIQPGKKKDDGTKWPDKFKKASSAGGGGGYRPRDPAETAAIVRQHSQAMALAWLQVGDNPVGITLDGLKPIIDWFDDDVASARGAVKVSSPEAEKSTETKPREAAPEIPADRARKILDAAVLKRLAQVEVDDDGDITGVVLTPSFQSKLIDVGCKTGKINNLNVDQAETVETWIEAERV